MTGTSNNNSADKSNNNKSINKHDNSKEGQ
jgi:hypothetical protein